MSKKILRVSPETKAAFDEVQFSLMKAHKRRYSQDEVLAILVRWWNGDDEVE